MEATYIYVYEKDTLTMMMIIIILIMFPMVIAITVLDIRLETRSRVFSMGTMSRGTIGHLLLDRGQSFTLV